MPSTILLVEDEVAIRDLLALTLSGDGYETIEAGTVAEAFAALDAAVPDLILLDWMLPGLSGLDFARRLKRGSGTAAIPIIMLTARAEEADKVKGLDTGADDFITKPFSTQELLARVRAVLRRTQGDTSADQLSAGDVRLDASSNRVTCKGQVLELSPTEFRLLHFFMAHPERVFSRGQLLDSVWGASTYIEERTVDVHIRRLRKLLEPHDSADLIQTVRGVGYRFSAQLP
ncbi:MAG: phosphate regulon transcriptional regulator PhoB [Gammaproteobacteria bacterium]|jgi:two-component system phosphate regulon response regulator PhoB